MESFLLRANEAIDDFYVPSKIINFILAEVDRKRKLFPFFKKKIIFSYSAYKKGDKKENIGKNPPMEYYSKAEIIKYFNRDTSASLEDIKVSERIIDNIIPNEEGFESAVFFQQKFDEIFKYYFSTMLPFDESRLKMKTNPQIINNELYLDYVYRFSAEEITHFINFKIARYIDEDLTRILELIFASIIYALSVLVNKIILENFQIEMLCARSEVPEQIRNMQKGPIPISVPIKADQDTFIHFSICIRQREKILKDFYLNTNIFHFSELFRQIPKEYKDKLRLKKDLIYLLALNRYPNLEPFITSGLYRIQKKSLELKHLTPLLDFMNYVFSRVEDSVYNLMEISTEVMSKYNLSNDQKEKLLEIFKFCNKNAGLFSSFQSNNRSQLQSQYQLFIFAIQYFFSIDIDKQEHQTIAFIPDIAKREINALIKIYPDFREYLAVLQTFLLNGFTISNNSSIDVFIKNIFNVSLMDINENFLSVFIFSFMTSINQNIDEINKSTTGPQPISYDLFVQYLIDVLDSMIKKVFLRKKPDEASKNFRDQLGRYAPKRVALRSLELILFKEMPLSDNIWQNYALSKNREYVVRTFQNYLTIPEDYFFSNKKLLHIVMMYQYSMDTSMYLEEWLFRKILAPFFKFVKDIVTHIENSIAEQPIENDKDLRERLTKIFFEIISKSIIDQRTLENLEQISEWLSDNLNESIMRIVEKKRK